MHPGDGPGAIDCHAHIFTETMPLAPDAWHRPPCAAPLDRYLACLDANGVARGVLAAASIFGNNNDYALQATRAHRRLRTTVIVDPRIELAEMRAMQAQGAVGVRFQWRSTPHPPDLASPEYQTHLRRIADIGWHVQLHDNGARLPEAIAAIERCGAPLVIDHFGRPERGRWTECRGFVAMLRAVARGNTWVKLSGGFRVGPYGQVARLAAALLRDAGPERLLWGSDWPFADFEGQVTYADTIAQFEAIVPDPAVRAHIHRTAASFYFSDEE